MMRMPYVVSPILMWATLLAACNANDGVEPSHVAPDASLADSSKFTDATDARAPEDGSVQADGSLFDGGSGDGGAGDDQDVDARAGAVTAACAAAPKTMCPTVPGAQCPLHVCPPDAAPNEQPCGDAAPCFLNVNPCWDWQVSPADDIDDWACGCLDGTLVCGLCVPGAGICRPEGGVDSGADGGG